MTTVSLIRKTTRKNNRERRLWFSESSVLSCRQFVCNIQLVE